MEVDCPTDRPAGRPTLLTRLARTRSFLLQAAVALLCPRAFLRAYYRQALPSGLVTPGMLFGLILSFDVDHERDVEALPELLAVLRDHGVRPSFALIGAFVEQFPTPHQALAEAGCELINHTMHHPNHSALAPDRFFHDLSREEMRAEIQDAHACLQRVCGVEAQGFRTPHFGDQHRADVYDVVTDLGYTFSSSDLAVRAPWGGLPQTTRPGLVEFPVSTCPRHPHSVLDSWHALERPRPWHARPGGLLGVVKELLALGREMGAFLNLYFDPAAILHLPDRDALLAMLAANQPATFGEMMAQGRYVENRVQTPAAGQKGD